LRQSMGLSGRLRVSSSQKSLAYVMNDDSYFVGKTAKGEGAAADPF
jgi:hypothetical protein